MDSLFENHLCFMAAHRGSVRFCRRDIHIDGPSPDLVSFVPASDESRPPHSCPAIRLAPWSGASWLERLAGLGYVKAEALAYMELADPYAPLAGASGIDVRVASSEADARVFASIQAAAFLNGETDGDAWWRDYFVEQALANFREPNQRFYLGLRDGQPVTSTLVIRASGVSGIYAVATRPEHRRTGLSAAVLEHARIDALHSGFPRIILQAVVTSYAQGYYERLGFQTRYLSQIWRL